MTAVSAAKISVTMTQMIIKPYLPSLSALAAWLTPFIAHSSKLSHMGFEILHNVIFLCSLVKKLGLCQNCPKRWQNAQLTLLGASSLWHFGLCRPILYTIDPPAAHHTETVVAKSGIILLQRWLKSWNIRIAQISRKSRSGLEVAWLLLWELRSYGHHRGAVVHSILTTQLLSALAISSLNLKGWSFPQGIEPVSVNRVNYNRFVKLHNDHRHIWNTWRQRWSRGIGRLKVKQRFDI